jgi:hypothetical protein
MRTRLVFGPKPQTISLGRGYEEEDVREWMNYGIGR